MAPHTLDSLPPEILDNISWHLTTPELGALRLTCKEIEAKLFEPFAVEYFTTKQFMLSTFSLQALVDISRHPNLGPRMKKVILSTDTVAPPHRSQLAHRHNLNPVEAASVAAHFKHFEDQERLRQLGDDVALLSTAFGHLGSRCTVIELRDYNSRMRKRDNCSWRSYGAPTIQRETGSNCRVDEPVHERLFRVVLTAMERSGHTFHEFETNFRSHLSNVTRSRLTGSVGAVPLSALLFSSSRQESTRTALKQLEVLRLALEVEDPGHTAGLLPHDDSILAEPLQNFLSFTPNLTQFRLNLQFCQGAPQFFSHVGLNFSLPQLSTFELGKTRIDEDSLVRLLKHFDTVTHLTIMKTTLHTGQWDRIWDCLEKEMKLKSLSLSSLQVGPRGQPIPVGWKKKQEVESHEDVSIEIKLSGSEADYKKLQENLVVMDLAFHKSLHGGHGSDTESQFEDSLMDDDGEDDEGNDDEGNDDEGNDDEEDDDEGDDYNADGFIL
ncbi:hypothetical protein K402DRAFT_63456 [Aulographum hederae CBS 113979]|uniref:F-box domain-containing protein n=1 Tax=Aulographum hederae CBS 113979 TaxID=1176131 RepID=A0A6G1H1Q4_9PEZI|nr:hypothetical protein K402DRAFT_63456 [Aulographum hederae CBS 113979]